MYNNHSEVDEFPYQELKRMVIRLINENMEEMHKHLNIYKKIQTIE
jgi:hypothetical protein